MTFLLHVDAARWGSHQAQTLRTYPGLVPVIKGNGYGFGQHLAADAAARLGVDTVAVGVPAEVTGVARHFPGRIVVLEPWEPAYSGPLDASGSPDRVVRTIASVAALRAACSAASSEAPVTVVLEGLTSMVRFGMDPDELQHALADDTVLDALGDGRLLVAGLALHLPITPPATGRVAEVLAWAAVWSQVRATVHATDGVALTGTLWVSHLEPDEVASVRQALPDVELAHRIGTRLWLGERSAYAPKSTVLAVHYVDPGDRVGYRQRRAPRGVRLVVVAGGTSHGIALTAPSAAQTVRQRAVAAGTGALDAAGRALSPFRIDGRRLWFAEPPHAQVSMLWLPVSAHIPNVGDLVDLEVRMTTVRFDDVRVSGTWPST
jgi:hypothetical protein